MFLRTAIASAMILGLTAGCSEAPDRGVEERVQRLEDEAAIKRIIEDYTVRLTSRDFDGYVDLFAPDGTWRNGDTIKNGRAEIKDMLLAMFPDTPDNYVNNDNYMLVSNIRVDLDGDKASTHSRQLTIARNKEGNPEPILSGMYEDEFVRIDGEWKIHSRNDITFIPTRERWGELMAEGILAAN